MVILIIEYDKKTLWKSKETEVERLQTMKIVGHSEYQTTADIYTHLDQEMMQATAEDLADVFKKVDTAARKKQLQRPASKVLWFPKTGS